MTTGSRRYGRIDGTKKTFTLTSNRWWQTLKDDSEDALPSSLAVLRSIVLLKSLQRWRARRRRGSCQKRHYAHLISWLRRWRRRRWRLITIKRDRSWSYILYSTRSWRRYLYLRPLFLQWWQDSHPRCIRRNRSNARIAVIAACLARRKQRACVRFWRVWCHVNRLIKRRCFRVLQYNLRLPPMVRALEHFTLLEGFRRWQRRALRWPLVWQKFQHKQRDYLLDRWRTRFVTASRLQRNARSLARLQLNGRIFLKLQHYLKLQHLLTDSFYVASSHWKGLCLSAAFALWWTKISSGGRQRMYEQGCRVALSYWRFRSAFLSFNTFKGSVKSIQVSRWADSTSRSHCRIRCLARHLREWRSTARRERLKEVCFEIGAGASIRAAFALFARRCRSLRNNGKQAMTINVSDRWRQRLVLGRWRIWTHARGLCTSQLRVARETMRHRIGPTFIRKWRHRVISLKRRRGSRLSILASKLLYSWRHYTRQRIVFCVALRRSDIRFQIRALTRALMHLKCRSSRGLQSKSRPQLRATLLHRALRKWISLLQQRGLRFAIFQQFLAIRGLRGDESTRGQHQSSSKWWYLQKDLRNFRLRTSLGIFIVSQVLQRNSLARWSRACFLRRVLHRLRAITLFLKREAIVFASVRFFAITRAAALALAMPKSVICRGRFILRKCWATWARLHHKRCRELSLIATLGLPSPRKVSSASRRAILPLQGTEALVIK